MAKKKRFVAFGFALLHAALPHRFGARVLAMCRALLKLSHAVSQHTAKPSAMSGNRRLCLFSPTMPREWHRRGCQAGVEIGGKRRRSDQRNTRLRARSLSGETLV